MSTNPSVTPNQNNTVLANHHYENFPVASFVLPKDLRYPITLIYHFARCADDFADEGKHTQTKRLALLQSYVNELDIIKNNGHSEEAFFVELAQMIQDRRLPLTPFYDLLDAFKQDVIKARYANFSEVLNYCKRSANPIGALLLHLFNKATPENLAYSDKICSALQLINFYQDVAIDFDDSFHPRRIYCCQNEMQQFGITEDQIAAQKSNIDWEYFMRFNVERAEAMLLAGKPLGRILPGRMGLEIRLIIASGENIIRKLKAINGDVFHKRPTITAWDWPVILSKALFI